MSLLSRDELRIFIGPQQVDLVHLAGQVVRKVVDKRLATVPDSAPPQTPWQPALSVLEEMLSGFRGCRANAVVVLSNHFVRYVLVRHSDETQSADEEQALIRHYFTNVYGSSAERWEYRLSDHDNEELQVAAAVNPELTGALAALFEKSKLGLRSLQPHLMAAFNLFRHNLGDTAWFALVEPGALCLAGFERNQWRFLRTLNCRDEWPEELAINLLRAQLMNKATDGTAEAPVYVFAPVSSENHRVQLAQRVSDLMGINPLLLCPAHPTDNNPATPLFAMALSG